MSTMASYQDRYTHTPQITRVTVEDAVAAPTGTTLTALLVTAGTVMQTWAKKVTLCPVAAGIYMGTTTATAASLPMGTDKFEFHDPSEALATLAFYAVADTYMHVVQEG